MKTYEVYLFRATNCIRGWLPYLRQGGRPCTVTVKIEAETGAKAKNAAITAANNAFRGVKIIGKNYSDPLWGLDNFPDTKASVEAAERGECL